MINQEAYDRKLLTELNKYSKRVKDAYLEAIRLVSQVTAFSQLDTNNQFFFKNNTALNNTVNEILKQLFTNVDTTIVEGINSGWDLAVEKNNQIAQSIYGKDLEELPKQYRTRYLSNNADARKAFVKRKDNGLGLSEKIWAYTSQFKQELELALELGLTEGKSASALTKDVRKYLNAPDKLFRRVRNKENGQLRLSKAAKAYHPGQGRYRSSYKNALRLTRNEINFSYEKSQEEKRKQQDFIVGIEIKVSPNHNPLDDKGGVKCILLQGKYPKNFSWTYKWHVNCKCMSLNIIKTQEELDADLDRILRGEEPTQDSSEKINNIPKQYSIFSNDKKFEKNRTFELNK